MELIVLQGVNLKNPVTTIIATMDGDIPVELVEKIKNTHEVFMQEYKVDGQTIEVQSKLPHFWKEALKAMNLLAQGTQNLEQTDEFIFAMLMKRQFGSMSQIPTMVAAQKMGYELTQFMIAEGVPTQFGMTTWNRQYALGVGQEIEKFKSIASSKDSVGSLKIQRDKWFTNSLVTRMSLPIAPWYLVDSEESLKEAFEKLTKPVVLKPTGLTQGNGVITNINDMGHALSSYKKVKTIIDSKLRPTWQQKIMIQQQVEGEDYRLLVVNGKLEIATLRIPAYVTGDGKSNLKELIEETNKDPRRNLKDPTHILKPIKLDDMIDEFLSEQGLTLETVPKDKERVYVRKIASMSQGGMTQDVTDKVHPQIKYLAESLTTTAKAFVYGIDVMCKDISKPLTIENGSFIEMNSMPEAFLNAFPTDGKQHPDLGEKIVKGLVGDKPRTKRIVVLGGKREQIEDKLSQVGVTTDTDRIGMLSGDSIYINNELMNSNLKDWKAIESLKINGSLSTIVLHYPDPEVVKNIGLGFDKVDLLIKLGNTTYDKALDSLVNQGSIGELIN